MNDVGATKNWEVSISFPSIPLFVAGWEIVLVGSGAGTLKQIDVLGPTVTSLPLGGGVAAVGSPSLDILNLVVYVGTGAGTVHAVRAPLP